MLKSSCCPIPLPSFRLWYYYVEYEKNDIVPILSPILNSEFIFNDKLGKWNYSGHFVPWRVWKLSCWKHWPLGKPVRPSLLQYLPPRHLPSLWDCLTHCPCAIDCCFLSVGPLWRHVRPPNRPLVVLASLIQVQYCVPLLEIFGDDFWRLLGNNWLSRAESLLLIFTHWRHASWRHHSTPDVAHHIGRREVATESDDVIAWPPIIILSLTLSARFRDVHFLCKERNSRLCCSLCSEARRVGCWMFTPNNKVSYRSWQWFMLLSFLS